MALNTDGNVTGFMEYVKTVLDRNANALELRPSIGQGMPATKVRLIEGLASRIEDGEWGPTTDMSEKSGGANPGPNPGVFDRGSLGSCLAVGYAMWAVRRGNRSASGP
jgi:hypothetical protein